MAKDTFQMDAAINGSVDSIVALNAAQKKRLALVEVYIDHDGTWKAEGKLPAERPGETVLVPYNWTLSPDEETAVTTMLGDHLASAAGELKAMWEAK